MTCSPPPRRRSRAEVLAELARLHAALAAAHAELAQLEGVDQDHLGALPISTAPASPTVYATAEHNPLGSARAFLNAHRRGAFPTFKRARNITARWVDVETWMRDPARKAKPQNDLEAELDLACAPVQQRKRS